MYRENAPVKGVIHTIAGGPIGGDSGKMRKRHEREGRSSRKSEFVMNTEREEKIIFGSKDLETEMGLQNDPIVIKMDIANFIVHKVLVNNGSSENIIFSDVLRKMGLDNAKLEPVHTPLIGFRGSEVTSQDTIELPVSIRDEPRRRTLMVKFLVVDTPFAYNVILGRPGLNLFRAIVSTYHLKLKFPTRNGIGEVSCDRKEVRRCYNLFEEGQLE